MLHCMDIPPKRVHTPMHCDGSQRACHLNGMSIAILNVFDLDEMYAEIEDGLLVVDRRRHPPPQKRANDPVNRTERIGF